ncbi:DUF1212-domain-containing protein [Atractiella rhizophila]|nr:DUF1212-domain-containing protein [Atractiella rhizophila]
MHVAAILQRQDFILKLARALMMFGAPTHRLENQIQATAQVLDIKCQVIYLYNFMIISFQDEEAHVSETRIIKQNSALDLGKLTQISLLHYEVCHDEIGVDEASLEISRLMQAKPIYGTWTSILIGGLCSVMIAVPSFNASFIDLLVSFPLGCLLVASQSLIAAKSQVLSSIFEIVIAAVISFTAAGLASTEYFCYAAVTSASIVLILPGWPVCSAALELQSRSIVSGSVRLVWAIIYSLFLGFGISLGAQFWELFSNQKVLYGSDNTCAVPHMTGNPDAPWWRQTVTLWTAFLFVPGFPFFLALRNQSPIFRREMAVSVAIAGVGWTTNHFAAKGFPGRSDITSACGAFAVGLLGNLWGKLQQGTSFIVTVVPVLFQLPSGLSNGGLLNFAVTTDNSTASFDSGFVVAEQLITVSIGLTVGLFISTVLVYPLGKKRGGLFSF